MCSVASTGVTCVCVCGQMGPDAACTGAGEPILGLMGTALPSDSGPAPGGVRPSLSCRVDWDEAALGPGLIRPRPALPFGLKLSSTHPACPGTGKSGLAHADLPRAGAGEPILGLAGADVPQ